MSLITSDCAPSQVGEPNGRAPQPSFVLRSRAEPTSEEREFGAWRAKHAAAAALAERGGFPSGRH